MSNAMYDVIIENGWQDRTAADLLPDLRALTVRDYVAKSVVNNFIVSNGLNLKLRAVVNAPYAENGPNDTVIPGTGFLTKRLVAQAGLDWLMTNNVQENGEPEVVNPDNQNLQTQIGLTQYVEIYSADEVAAFWALFEKPLFPELQTEDEAALAMVRGALNTPKIEQCETELTTIQAEYEAALTPIVERRDAWEQAKIKLQNGEDVELPE